MGYPRTSGDRPNCLPLAHRQIYRQAARVSLFVPPDQVSRVAAETGAIPYDIPGVELTHVGEDCSFDSFVSKYGLGGSGTASFAVALGSFVHKPFVRSRVSACQP
jgi:hypothetical protein